MSSKNRASSHKGKKGSAKHNQHDFYGKDKQTTLHSYINAKQFNFDLTKAELSFYERYAEQLTIQNQKYRDKRNYSRVKSLEQFYKSKRYQPTEEMLQYGNVDTVNKTSRDDFEKMTAVYAKWLVDWSKSHGNHLHVLDWSNHYDEATPHSHMRYIWDYNDNGIPTIHQEKAMEQAGIPLPDPSKPVGRYNNRNMTFSKMCRDKWLDICEQYGYEVERTPLPNTKKIKSKDIEAYKAEQERKYQEKLSDLQEIIDKTTETCNKLQERCDEYDRFFERHNVSKERKEKSKAVTNKDRVRVSKTIAEQEVIRQRMLEASLMYDELTDKQDDDMQKGGW